MLKHILILLMMIVSLPSFATDVLGGETCDTDVLNTDTGPVNLRAEFEPETINLYWYNDGNQVAVPTASNSCTYDTPINLPTDPVKPGYKFKGWRVVPPFDFSTLPTNENFISGYGKHSYDLCRIFTPSGGEYGEYQSCTNDVYSDLRDREWKAIFSFGTIYGTSVCSSTASAGFGTVGIPNETVNSGNTCWCRVTGYTPNGSIIKHTPLQTLPWISRHAHDTLDKCSYGCTSRCAYMLGGRDGNGATIRARAFGVTQ